MNDKQLAECKYQGELFRESLTLDCSSPVFIRRFMNSSIAERMDQNQFLFESGTPDALLSELETEYGKSTYGKKKYSADELYWIGFTYRYWNAEFGTPSKKIYRTINGEKMRALYYPYHSLDVKAAVERILESNGLLLSEEEEHLRQLNIIRALFGR